MFGGTDPSHPRYVVGVMIEQGGRGGNVAAPIARQIIDAVTHAEPFTGQVPQLTPGHD